VIFTEIAEEIDDETWLFHLPRKLLAPVLLRGGNDHKFDDGHLTNNLRTSRKANAQSSDRWASHSEWEKIGQDYHYKHFTGGFCSY
jgi:hypothetical protein